MKRNLLKRQTLFFKIFISSLVIIMLFSVFNLVSIKLFSSTVQNEIIQYNRLILKNSAERYRTHFNRVKTLLFSVYNDEKVVAFNRQLLGKNKDAVEFWKVSDLLKDIRSQAYNPLFYLNNLMIYFHSDSFIVEKEGTSEAGMLFSKFYASKEYDLAFWQKQLRRIDNYVIHPGGTFSISTLNSAADVQLIPFSFKTPNSNYEVIALLDARELQKALYVEEDNMQFMIVKENGELLYRSSDAISVDGVPVFEPGKDYRLAGGYYYFAESDPDNKLTYITAVPYANVAAKVRNASLTLLLVFAVAIAIGILASLYFSRRINQPVKQIVSSIMRRDPVKLHSAIHEFDLIHQNVHELLREKESIHKELLSKKSLLTSFGYINKLKAIMSDIDQSHDIAAMDGPFFVILYQLHFKTVQIADNRLKTDRMAYYIQEYINVVIAKQFPSAHTFQIENNQILSLIPSREQSEPLDDALRMLKEILDRDNAYFLSTIAVSSVYEQTDSFNEAYRQVLEMMQQAKLCDECQIVRRTRSVPARHVFTVPQEQELYSNLQAGNYTFCIQFMERTLDLMDKKEASLYQFQELAQGIVARVAKILEPFRVDTDSAMQQQHLQQLQECYTLGQFKQFYAELFQETAAIIQTKKEEKDPIVTFAMDYMETRFADDVTLDLLADKLSMSPAYLSVYIKEKTGANFSDHINAIRIRKAKELLADTDLSMQDISIKIGYRNATSFFRMFKKVTGMPPGEYRKNKMFEAGGSDLPSGTD